jgi:hypothetical protein
VSYGVAAAAKILNNPAGSRVLVLQNDHSSAMLAYSTNIKEPHDASTANTSAIFGGLK